MSNIRFDCFDDDVEIKGIGNYFRSISGNTWSVDLKLYPKQSRNYLTASNASELIRGHILNPVNEKDKVGWKRSFRISDATLWEIRTLGDCPASRSEKWSNPHQLCFVFMIDDGITVYLPHFELARTLFFHGGYLSRTAIESECMKAEFSVEIDEENNAFIEVMKSSGFSVSHLNEPKTRNYLAWLLLNNDARTSFESIARYQRLKGQDFQKYRRWDFQFDPPPLKGVGLRVHGQYSEEDKVLFVYQIDQIEGIPNKKYKSISMWHPDFEHSIPGGGHMVQPAGAPQEAPLTIHDDVVSNANMQPVLMDGNKVSIEFQHPFYVSKKTTKAKKRPTSETSDESKDNITSVSTEEGVADRGLPGGEWDTLEDDTDYEGLFESKFECFMKMIDVLIKQHGCVLLDKWTTQLQPVGKGRKHLLSTDDTPRNIAVAALQVEGKIVHLLEVDTSDAEQSLSTQILILESLATWNTEIKKLKTELVKSSLRWPQKLLEKLCGPGRHKGVNHPQAPAGNKGVLAQDSIAGWAARIFGWMLRL